MRSKEMKRIIVAMGLLIQATYAQAACPSNGTVTVPFPTGEAAVTINSNPACVALVGTDLKVQLNNLAGPVLNDTTKPAVILDAAGIRISANGAPFGAAYTLYITHIPSNKVLTLIANVGQATQSITASTTTP